MSERDNRAKDFHALHQGPDLLILANVSDAGGARLAGSLGAKAIATTSAGLAWSLGYADGGVLPPDVYLGALERIARVTDLPLSADFEDGYSDDPKKVGEFAARFIQTGVVGINIEDGTDSPDLLCRKIAAVRASAGREGVDLFINARTDVYLRQLKPESGRVEESLARGRRYAEAGASGLFVAGVADAEEISELAEASPLPLNVLARPGLPDAAELTRLGVRRLSAGSAIAQSQFDLAAALVEQFLRDGDSAIFEDRGYDYGRINTLFA